MFGKRAKDKKAEKQLTPREMMMLQDEMDPYISQIEARMRDVVLAKSSSLDSIQQNYVMIRYRDYLSRNYVTPLMLEYVNNGRDNMWKLINDIVNKERENIKNITNVDYIGGPPDFSEERRGELFPF